MNVGFADGVSISVAFLRRVVHKIPQPFGPLNTSPKTRVCGNSGDRDQNQEPPVSAEGRFAPGPLGPRFPGFAARPLRRRGVRGHPRKCSSPGTVLDEHQHVTAACASTSFNHQEVQQAMGLA